MSLTREECLEAHKELDNALLVTDYMNGRTISTYPVYKDELGIFRKLIDEHFELVEKYDKLKRENLGLKQTIKNLREKEAKRYSDIMGSKFI